MLSACESLAPGHIISRANTKMFYLQMRQNTIRSVVGELPRMGGLLLTGLCWGVALLYDHLFGIAYVAAFHYHEINASLQPTGLPGEHMNANAKVLISNLLYTPSVNVV